MKLNATFLFGAASLESAPNHSTPEIAFLGRSNVGKSSLLNRVCGDATMARVSRTPGRTQQLNFFGATLITRGNERLACMLVDVPGFGYAKLSGQTRRQLDQLVRSYLQERSALRGIILLNDCRRAPEDEELAVQELTYEREIPLILVLTKCDKLKAQELALQRRQRASEYHLEPYDLLLSDNDSFPSALLGRLSLLLRAER